MSFRQRWYRFRYHLEINKRKRSDLWGVSAENIRFLIENLRKLQVTPKYAHAWKDVRIEAKWKTVDGFLRHLSWATEIMKTNNYVIEPTKLLIQPNVIRLFDYFITEEMKPLTWDEVIDATSRIGRAFVDELDSSGKGDEIRQAYYRRKYIDLIEALYHFLQLLCGLVVRE